MNHEPLKVLALDQKRWSLTAGRLKSSIGRARLQVLALAVGGAVLETSAAQMTARLPSTAHVLSYLGAAMLVAMAVVRQWKLSHDSVQAWIFARSASESLKREMFLYRTAAQPYDGAEAAQVLLDRRSDILEKVRPVQSFRVEPKEQVAAPGLLDADGYLAERIEGASGQVHFLNARAAQFARSQNRLRALEFGLALLGALLSVAVTSAGKPGLSAWVAVITTISAAVGSHLAAQRYEFLTVSYRATADLLEGAAARWRAGGGTLSQLVNSCETILLNESQGWIAGVDDVKASAKGADAAAQPAGSAGAGNAR